MQEPEILNIPDHWIPHKETPEWGNECTVFCTNIYQITCNNTNNHLTDFTRFSSLSKLLGSTWNVYKFKIKLIKKLRKEHCPELSFTPKELGQMRLFWVKHTK